MVVTVQVKQRNKVLFGDMLPGWQTGVDEPGSFTWITEAEAPTQTPRPALSRLRFQRFRHSHASIRPPRFQYALPTKLIGSFGCQSHYPSVTTG